MQIYQLLDGYRYNTDTMILYDFILNSKPKGKLLDAGCGSGVLGLLLKRDMPNLNVVLLDILNVNTQICQENANLNSLNCDIINADFCNFKNKERFDFIISNPPFYRDQIIKSENLHINTSRYALNLPLEDFIVSAKENLSNFGELIFCYDATKIVEIAVCLQKYSFTIKKMRFVYTKILKPAYLVLVHAKKNSNTLTEILSPFIIRDENNILCSKMEQICKAADLESIEYNSANLGNV